MAWHVGLRCPRSSVNGTSAECMPEHEHRHLRLAVASCQAIVTRQTRDVDGESWIDCERQRLPQEGKYAS